MVLKVFGGCFKNARYMQYLAAIAASLAYCSYPVSVTWTSSALSKLQKSSMSITTEDRSWISSSLLLGTLPGYLVSGLLAEAIGRRKTFLLSTAPAFLPWLLLAFANSVLLICIGRFILGFFGSICVACCSIYVGEISEEDIRGKTSTLIAMIAACAKCIILAIGPFLPYQWFTAGCALVPAVAFLFFLLMPESPHYLMKVGKTNEAEKALKILSANNISEKDFGMKVEKIQQFIQDSGKKKANFMALFQKQYWFPILVMLGLEGLRNLSGGIAITSNVLLISEESGGGVSPQMTNIIVGLVQIPGVVLVGLLVDRLGRKPLLMLSCLASGVCLFAEAYYFYMRKMGQDTSEISWLPAVALVGYFLGRNLGLIGVPIILLGELFAANIKGVAVSFSTLSSSTMNFLILKYFDPINELFGIHVSFFAYGVVCFLGIFFTYFIVPETKNKSFMDIQAKLNRRRKVEQVKDYQITHL